MGFVREQEGVDFIINGKPLTEKQKINQRVRADKEKCKTLILSKNLQFDTR